MKRMYSLLAIFVTMAFAFVSPISGRIVFPIPEPDSSVFVGRDSSVYDFFTKMQSCRQEKLYLHQNQPYYGAGDTIWFKAYLADAVSHRPDTLSNFIYVDLADRKGTFVLSRKVRRDSLGFANCLPLPDTLPAGEYTLRAYTGWMLNFDPAFFFQRNLSVGNTRSDRVRTDITYTSAQAIVRFTDADQKPIRDAGASYELFDRNGKRMGGVRQQTTTTGALFVDLPEDSIRNGGYLQVRLDEGGASFRRTLFLEPAEQTFAVQFFPEGGDLVAGVPRLVAFKAERPDGYPADVQGAVLKGNGDTVVSFLSEHDGMGTFLFCPQVGETYRAVCRAGELESDATLPEVRQDACALTVVQAQGRIHYKADGTIPEGSRLVGHIRGNCCCIVPVDLRRPSGTILTDSLPEGILHLLLVDGAGRPRSERLVFVNKPEKRERWTVTPDKPRYGKREKVCVEIGLKDCDGNPVEADLSVSVTDRRAVGYDSLRDNIRTNLLLCSDIRGYVHNPGYYFLDGNPARKHRLDLVMMTNGWRRFNTENLYTPAPFAPKHFFEHGQYLSGKVIGIVGKVAPEATVDAVALTDDNVLGTAVTDGNGNFVIEGLDYRDTTLFMVSAKTRRGKPVQRIEIDQLYPRPSLQRTQPFINNASTSVQESIRNYMKQQKDQHATLNGMKVYDLDGVEVIGRNPRAPRNIPYGMVYDTAALSKFKPMSLYNYAIFLPFVYRMSGVLYMKNVDQTYLPLKTTLDGRVCSAGDLTGYTVDDVEYILHIRKYDMRSAYDRTRGVNADNYPCCVEFYLKPDRNRDREFQTCTVIGYSENIEFYHPMYDTPEKRDNETPDLRTTLYWNPYVKTDPDGNTTIEFYTNDTEQADYNITIEGLIPEGTVYRYQQQLCN